MCAREESSFLFVFSCSHISYFGCFVLFLSLPFSFVWVGCSAFATEYDMASYSFFHSLILPAFFHRLHLFNASFALIGNWEIRKVPTQMVYKFDIVSVFAWNNPIYLFFIVRTKKCHFSRSCTYKSGINIIIFINKMQTYANSPSNRLEPMNN